MMDIEKIKCIVLTKEKPTETDYLVAKRVYERIKEKGEEILRQKGIDGEIKLVGSIAKDTWLREDRDMDIFILIPPNLGIEALESVGLEIAKQIVSQNYVEKYAEHPYIEAQIENFIVDIVPCFKVSSPRKVLSAVDRTPFHTEYIMNKLSSKQKDEVRILKRFLKGVGIYGAEVKIEGFSGYLTELLIAYYGNFEEVLREAGTSWRPWRTVIDVEGHYSNLQVPLRKFKSPLVVVDPVDPDRNAAAAVSWKSLSEFILASREFLRKPSLRFFYPSPSKPISSEELDNIISKRDTHLVIIWINHEELAPDTLWGELKKSLAGIRNLLLRTGYGVIDYGAWSNEKNSSALLFELERIKMPAVELHRGPYVHEEQHATKFLDKYLKSPDALTMPFVKNGRLYIYRRRRYGNVRDLLKNMVLSVKLGKHIRKALSQGFEIYINHEIHSLLKIEEFSKYLREFLEKGAPWMRSLK